MQLLKSEADLVHQAAGGSVGREGARLAHVPHQQLGLVGIGHTAAGHAPAAPRSNSIFLVADVALDFCVCVMQAKRSFMQYGWGSRAQTWGRCIGRRTLRR